MEKRRNIGLDCVRIFAMVMVILVHSYPHLHKFYNDSSIEQYINSAIISLAFSCNGLFFILSGYFVLDNASRLSSDEYLVFYWKRFTKILFPALIVGVIYYLDDISSGSLQREANVISEFFIRFLTGNTSGHYWFVYTIIAVYILTPFLGKMLSSLDDKGLTYYVMIIFLCQLIFTTSYFTSFTINNSTLFGFGSWLLYYQLGYYFRRMRADPSSLKMVGLLIAGVTLSVLLKKYAKSNQYIDNLAITELIITISLFFLLSKISVKDNFGVISFLSKHSYSTYLLQTVCIRHIVFKMMKADLGGKLVPVWILSFLLTVIVSIALAAILDNYILFPISAWFQSKGISEARIKKYLSIMAAAIIALELIYGVSAGIEKYKEEHIEELQEEVVEVKKEVVEEKEEVAEVKKEVVEIQLKPEVSFEQALNYGVIVIKNIYDHSEMQAAVWCNDSGNADVKWYPMDNKEDGCFMVVFDLNNHEGDGKYSVHFYAIEEDGRQYVCGSCFNVIK